MIRDLLRVLLVGGVVVSSLACAAKRPVLYPNARLQAVGTAAAQQDIDDCLQKAAAGGIYLRSRGQGRGVHRGGSRSRGRSGRGRGRGCRPGRNGRGHGRGRGRHGRPYPGALPFPGPEPGAAAVCGPMPQRERLRGHRLAIGAGRPRLDSPGSLPVKGSQRVV